MRKSFTNEMIEIVCEIFDKGTYDIFVDDFLKDNRVIPPGTRKAIQKYLSTFAAILRKHFNYDVCVTGQHYLTQRYLGINTPEQGRRCLPTRSEDNKPWGLHKRTGPNDQISNAAYEQTTSVEYGIRKISKGTIARGVSTGIINPHIATMQDRIVSQRFPLVQSTTHFLVPEIVKIDVFHTNAYWKWLPIAKQLPPKKDVKSDTNSGGDEGEELA